MVPRAQLAPLLRDPDVHNLRVLRGGQPLVTLLRDHVRSLLRQVPRMGLADALGTVDPTLQLVASALNGRAEAHAAGGVRQALLGAVRRHIEQRLDDPALSPAAIGAAFGLSRATVYRLFEPLGGIAGYVRERRLRRILVEIAKPANARRSIADIALEWGFVNHADFSRAFRRRFALTPRDARRLALAAPLPAGGGDPERAWMDWVRNAH